MSLHLPIWRRVASAAHRFVASKAAANRIARDEALWVDLPPVDEPEAEPATVEVDTRQTVQLVALINGLGSSKADPAGPTQSP